MTVLLSELCLTLKGVPSISHYAGTKADQGETCMNNGAGGDRMSGINEPTQTTMNPTATSLRGSLAGRMSAAFILLGSVFGFSVTAQAQALDASLLQNLQKGLSGMGASNVTTYSPVDMSRQGGDGSGLGDASGMLPGMMDSEKALREQQARALLLKAYKPSIIEAEYRDRTGDKELRQFGYDLFELAAGQSTSFTGRMSGNYVVGVGDEFVVMLQGPEPRNITTRVDHEGRLIVDQLPPISAAGRRLDAVISDIQAATRQTMLGTEAQVSLGAVRTISVVVGGEVERPGQYTLTALSDITQVFARARGIKRTGSLRQVRVERGGRSFTVDLYGLLGIGTPPNIRLQDGDRIVVPTIGRTVAVTGSVVRPGIFELAPGTQLTLAQATAFAGGAVRPSGNEYSVLRLRSDGEEEVVSLTQQSAALQSGDVVQVMGRERSIAGKVTLTGFVSNAGVRSLDATPTVKSLLGSVKNLRLGSYLPFAVLLRRDPISSATAYSGVNLYDVFYENQDVALRSEDHLIILGNKDIAFVQSPEVRSIVLGQPNPIKECRSLAHLELLVQDSQSDRFAAVTRGSFIVDKGNGLDLAGSGGAQNRLGISNMGQLETVQQQAGLAGQSLQMKAGLAGLSLPVEQPNADQQRTNDQERDAKLRESDPEKYQELLNQICPKVFEDNPAVLPFLLENVVVLGGNLRRPGIYPVWGTVPVPVIASVAEGLASRAESFSIDLTRSDPYSGATHQSAMQGTLETFDTVKVSAGDDLRFNTLQPQYEVGAVLLTGEFLRPGLYSIRKGETLSQLIERAGGISEYAYPYGAVFTRRSVKQAQQEGFQRTAREMKTALLAVSARKNVSADALAGAMSLTQELASIESMGRMVVEADPEVLAAYPEADTVLEAGDSIYMPKKPNFILTVGDVLNPGALQFSRGKSARDYIQEAGGIQRSADDGRAFIVYPNGVAQPLKTSGWFRTAQAVVPPGSTIVVPKNIDPLYTLDIVKDVATIIGQFATSIAAIAVIANQ